MRQRRMIVTLIAAFAALATALSLGNWQLRRAQQKLALQLSWDSAERQAPVVITGADIAAIGSSLPRRVRMSGRFLHEHEVWLENRQMDGRSGFFLITPLRLADGAVVPVNRGFASRDAGERARLPPVERPESEVIVEGLAVAQPPRVLPLGEDAPRGGSGPIIWQNFDFDAFDRASGLRVARWVVQQTTGGDDGLLRLWPPLGAGVEKHHGYAFQWFALAALIAGLTLFFGVRALHRRTARSETEG